MTDKIRIGVSGAGLIARSSHIPAIYSHPHTMLAAITDPILANARKLADLFDFSGPVVPDIEEIFDAVDAVIVAAPNHVHASIATQCMQAGKPVLVEKPLACTVSECHDIISVSKETKVLVAVGYCTRFRDNVATLKRVVQSQEFGRVSSFSYQYGSIGGWAPISNYNSSTETSGGGALMVSASHAIDRLYGLFGAPDDVRCWDDSEGGPEANTICEFGWKNARSGGPVSGSIRVSKTARMRGGFCLKTDRGTLVLEDVPSSPVRFLPDNDKGRQYMLADRDGRSPRGEGDFLRQLDNFLAGIKGEADLSGDAEAGLGVQEMIERCYQNRRPLSEYSPGVE